MKDISDLKECFDNELDKLIVDMVDYHRKTGSKFIRYDTPQKLKLGWVSEDMECNLLIRLSTLKSYMSVVKVSPNTSSDTAIYKISTDILNLFNINNLNIIPEKFTNKNYKHYVKPEEFMDFINMEGALK